MGFRSGFRVVGSSGLARDASRFPRADGPVIFIVGLSYSLQLPIDRNLVAIPPLQPNASQVGGRDLVNTAAYTASFGMHIASLRLVQERCFEGSVVVNHASPPTH